MVISKTTVRPKDGAVEQGNFHDYRLMRLDECPAITVEIINGNHEKLGGAGEPGLPPAAPALANAIAAVFGITVSFLGSRYFVFHGRQGSLARQGSLFLLIYAAIAVLHALVMYVWADRWGLDYRAGFVLATGMQMAVSFVANKFLVFK